MKKILLFISVFFITVLQTSAQCPDYTVKSVTAYRTTNKVAIGKIEVTADYAGSYKVLLYHPDNKPGSSIISGLHKSGSTDTLIVLPETDSLTSLTC